MPYRVRERDCEQSDGTSGSHVVEKMEGDSWSKVSCHTSEAKAEAAKRARYASEGDSS